MNQLKVYLEIGKKRTFAGALDWPGWCRSGRDEPSALEALLDYGPRYADVLRPAGIAFQLPSDESTFTIVERLEGNATTDFGAPAVAPTMDDEPIDEDELQRFQAVLKACWQAFDAAVQAAGDKELRKGPRGGGRETEGIVSHVVESDGGYLSALGWKFKQDKTADLSQQWEQTRQAILEALAATAHGEIATQGPRGGMRWRPRYFVRRTAWHVLDHAWEIEDRMS